MKVKEKTVLSMCICATCPTYKDCSKEGKKKELGFCFITIGKSKCIKVEKGCLCGGCPFHMKMNFKNFYYCIKDSEIVQEKTKK